MQTFVNDDAAYLAWIASHPAGFVGNAPRAGREPLTLHRAACPFIGGPGRTNYTSTSYYKVCALDLTELIGWAARQEANVKICAVCWRDRSDRAAPKSASHARNSSTKEQSASDAEPAPTGGELAPLPLAEVSVSIWQLWAQGPILQEIDGVRPLLASWNANTDPAQIRLRAYLEDLSATFGPTLQDRSGLFLHMDIDVEQPERLLHHYDLENYLTPMVHHLGAARFVLASATKRVGGGSQIRIGVATPVPAPPPWAYYGGRLSQAATSKQGQAAIRAALMQAISAPLPPGPVAVHLAWRCSSGRNWVSFWKPTGDAMGPILGEPYPNRPFYPNDDRIVALHLHRQRDDTLGSAVDLGMWWQSLVRDIRGGEYS